MEKKEILNELKKTKDSIRLPNNINFEIKNNILFIKLLLS